MSGEPEVVDHEPVVDEGDDQASEAKTALRSMGISFGDEPEEDTETQPSEADEPSEEPEAAEAAEAESDAGEEWIVPKERLIELAKEIVGPTPAERGFQRREQRRADNALTEENAKLRAAYNELVSSLRGSVAPKDAQQADEPSEEEDPDIFIDPDQGVRVRVQRELKPLQEQIQKLSEMLNVARGQQVLQSYAAQERAYGEANPDYFPAMREFREKAFSSYLDLGLSEEDSTAAIQALDEQIIQVAQMANRPAWEVAHQMALNALGRSPAGPASAPAQKQPPTGQQARAQQPQPQARQRLMQQPRKPGGRGSMMSTRAAAEAPEAGTISGSGGSRAVTPSDALLDGSFTSEDVQQLLAKRGGRAELFKVLEKIEAEAWKEERRGR